MDPKPAEAPDQRREGGRYLPPILVAVLAVAAFLPAFQGEFTNWDDDANFLANPHYRGLGWENLKWMFTTHYGHYMPLTWLTLGLDYALWGMKPAGYHATSILLHALNAVLLYFLLKRLLPASKGAVAAALGALFFAIHPLRVESVAWITERRDVTAGAFFLLTLLAYVRMAAEPPGPGRRRWLWLSCAAFTGMLLSKSMGMTLPLVLLVLDAVPLRRYATERPAALLREKIPLFVLMIGGIVLTSLTQNSAEAIYDRNAYPLVQSVAQPGYRISFYVLKTLVPVPLSPLYWYRPGIGWPQALGWTAVISVTALLLIRRRALPEAAAAWAAFLILIGPVSGVFQAGPHFAADRYTYFACIPFAALFAAAVPPRIGLAAGGLVLAVLGTLTWRQCGIWKDSVALWTHAIKLDPDVYFTYGQRGMALAELGRWDEAQADFSRSLELNAGWFQPWSGRARARLAKGDAPGAVADATRALELHPRLVEAHHTRALAFARLGRAAEAIADFSAALDVRPGFLEARMNRGKTRAMAGDLAGAEADFARTLELAPPDWPLRRPLEELLQRARSERPR